MSSDNDFVGLEVLTSHAPPGNLADLSTNNEKRWSEKISSWMKAEIDCYPKPLAGPCNKDRTKLSQFFDGTVTAFETKQPGASVTWKAFPGIIQEQYGDENTRWAIADYSRMVQDEYCEWSVMRNSDNNIVKVTFTCEGPEYWQFVADWQDGQAGETTVLDLYRQLNPQFVDQIDESDLYLQDEKTGAKVYNPQNAWNCRSTTGCIAHLIHPSNSLSAEIDIAAQATVIRLDKNGKPITEKTKLINCSKYGQALRNSDPNIGAAINQLAREGNSLSVKDPIALYMQSFDPQWSKLTLEGTPIEEIPGVVTFTRGELPTGLRFSIQIPASYNSKDGLPKTVSDILDGNNSNTITYGAQFADYINMTVNAVVIPNYPVAAAQKCPCDNSAMVTNSVGVLANGGGYLMKSESVHEQPKVHAYKSYRML